MDKIAVITGGGSGIGRAISMRLAEAGYSVVVNDIIRDAGEKVLSDMVASGRKGLFSLADVSDVSQVKRMFQEIKEKHGKVDVLVNNAGIPGRFSTIAEMADETWHKTISVHLNGAFYCLREAAQLMRAAGSGRIINIASIAGIHGTVGSAEYGAAKAAVINLTKTAAKELGPSNVTVNAIAPGMVGTSVNLKLKEKASPFIEKAIEGTPTGRMTRPEEIAELALFLSSPAAANINGQVICVDGGADITISMDQFMYDYLSKKVKR